MVIGENHAFFVNDKARTHAGKFFVIEAAFDLICTTLFVMSSLMSVICLSSFSRSAGKGAAAITVAQANALIHRVMLKYHVFHNQNCNCTALCGRRYPGLFLFQIAVTFLTLPDLQASYIFRRHTFCSIPLLYRDRRSTNVYHLVACATRRVTFFAAVFFVAALAVFGCTAGFFVFCMRIFFRGFSVFFCLAGGFFFRRLATLTGSAKAVIVSRFIRSFIIVP
ncbi:MAG: hypothetical protein U1F16_05250 [Turneriella sp.]